MKCLIFGWSSPHPWHGAAPAAGTLDNSLWCVKLRRVSRTITANPKSLESCDWVNLSALLHRRDISLATIGPIISYSRDSILILLDPYSCPFVFAAHVMLLPLNRYIVCCLSLLTRFRPAP